MKDDPSKPLEREVLAAEAEADLTARQLKSHDDKVQRLQAQLQSAIGWQSQAIDAHTKALAALKQVKERRTKALEELKGADGPVAGTAFGAHDATVVIS